MALPQSTLPESAPALPMGALATTRRRLWVGAWRQLLVVGSLCLGIALLLTALDGRGFGPKLVYSLCIGAVCTILVGGVRLLAAMFHDRLRKARGLPASPDFNGWAGAVPGALVAVLLGPSLGLTAGDWLTGQQSASIWNLASSSTRMTLVLSVLGTAISLAVIGSLERLSSARAAAEAAQRQAAEHQLRLLQSQLEPHMLFNTLANLRVLIGLDAAQAQAMLDRLIGFLRATLNASRLSVHPLATEFDRIADYLALMGVRMGDRLQTRLLLPEALRELPVPPLLLQPLVENAIKHGLEPHVQGGLVTVSARVEGHELLLSVRDTGVGLNQALANTEGSRFGLAQVRERLATLHGSRASLTLQSAPDAMGGTLVTIRMPLPTSP
ncbi:MAG: histidine kinase [Rubrivivax sp.]|nr:histidine kinase [Rubrivivax sp.]